MDKEIVVKIGNGYQYVKYELQSSGLITFDPPIITRENFNLEEIQYIINQLKDF